MLHVTELTKSFGGYTAVDNVSMSVKEGEVRAIIGPNGAGKTTLFNLLSGHLKPTKGQVSLGGRQISGRPPHKIARHGVSRAFQTTNIFPTFSVFDNVLISVLTRHRRQFRLWGRNDRDMVRRVEDILNMVNLTDAKSQLAGTLAHGDQRALEVAIALGANPHVLLLDEPTAGMSPFETQDMIRLISRVVQENKLTVVLSEHDMEVVFGLADKITVIEAGRVIADGSPDEIKTNPEVIRAYLGEVQ